MQGFVTFVVNSKLILKQKNNWNYFYHDLNLNLEKYEKIWNSMTFVMFSKERNWVFRLFNIIRCSRFKYNEWTRLIIVFTKRLFDLYSLMKGIPRPPPKSNFMSDRQSQDDHNREIQWSETQNRDLFSDRSFCNFSNLCHFLEDKRRFKKYWRTSFSRMGSAKFYQKTIAVSM